MAAVIMGGHDMNVTTPLKKTRGLGSAKNGTNHWWVQRLTSVTLIPLTLWFVFSILSFGATDYNQAIIWAGEPHNSVLLLMLVIITFHHSQLGLQVVIEDYIHCEIIKICSLIGMKFLNFAFAVTGCFAILKIAFGG